MLFSLSHRRHHHHHHPFVNTTNSPLMTTERWVAAAITTDALVADLLLHLKRSSSSDPPPPPPPPPPLNPPVWGDRKSRSKPTATAAVVKGHQHRSPSTPLSWSDGSDEFSCPSDLCSGDGSVKIDLHQHPKKECEAETMKRRRCMLPDLNETPADE